MAKTPTDDNPNLLTVIAYMTAKPGKEQELRDGLLDLIPKTETEDGFINYDLHVAVNDPATYMLYENWTSHEALDAHLANDHLVAFANQLGDLLVGGADGLVITRLQRVYGK